MDTRVDCDTNLIGEVLVLSGVLSVLTDERLVFHEFKVDAFKRTALWLLIMWKDSVQGCRSFVAENVGHDKCENTY